MLGTCCLIFIIILLPPLGVFFMKGCGADFWINLCLTLLGYLPGHVHALYVLIREREEKAQEQRLIYQNQAYSQGQAYGSQGQGYNNQGQTYDNKGQTYGAVPTQ